MPFQSEDQRRIMWAKHPEIAKKWAHEESPKKKRKVGTYSDKDVNKAREMVGEGKASNVAKPYARGGIR